MSHRIICVLLLFFSFQCSSICQSNCGKWGIGVDADLLNPTKELQTNGFGINLGINIDAFYLDFEKNKIGLQPGFRIRAGGSGMDTRGEFIGDPINQEGSRGVYNFAFDTRFVGRIVFNYLFRIQPYLEAEMGVRFAGAQEQIQTFGSDEEDSLDYSQYITKGISGSYGFGGGLIIRMTDRANLNLRSNFDLTGLIKHVDRTTIFPYDETRTTNAINQRFAIGVFIRLGCETEDENLARKNSIGTRNTKKRKMHNNKVTKSNNLRSN